MVGPALPLEPSAIKVLSDRFVSASWQRPEPETQVSLTSDCETTPSQRITAGRQVAIMSTTRLIEGISPHLF